MKFTQTDAAKKISGILTRGGKDQQLSDRTIAENIDSLMKALVNDETELDDFIKQVEPMFKTWQANAKKDNSDFINKWNEEHTTGDPDPDSQGKGENPEMKALMERIAANEAELATLKREREESAIKASIEQKRKDIIAKLKEKGVKDDEWLNEFLSEVNITAELDVESKSESWLKLYNKVKANGGSAVPPPNPNGGGGGDLDSLKAASELAKRQRELREQAMK